MIVKRDNFGDIIKLERTAWNCNNFEICTECEQVYSPGAIGEQGVGISKHLIGEPNWSQGCNVNQVTSYS